MAMLISSIFNAAYKSSHQSRFQWHRLWHRLLGVLCHLTVKICIDLSNMVKKQNKIGCGNCKFLLHINLILSYTNQRQLCKAFMLLTYSRKSNSQRCFLADIFEGLQFGVFCNIMCTLKVTKSTCNKKKYHVTLTEVSSADNVCKQFGPRSGPTKCRAWSGSRLFETLMVFQKS